MELHRAQNFRNAVVSHLPGLFRKTSDMDWEKRKKLVWHVLDADVRRLQFQVDGRAVDVFVNSHFCFIGIRFAEGFKPIAPSVARELMERYPDEFRPHTEQKRPESFEANKARAEVGRLLSERKQGLSGPKRAGNTRRLRTLSKKFGIRLPEGI